MPEISEKFMYLWNSKSKIAFESIPFLDWNKKCSKIYKVIPKELIYEVMGLIMKGGVKTETGCNSLSLQMQNLVESESHFLCSQCGLQLFYPNCLGSSFMWRSL